MIKIKGIQLDYELKKGYSSKFSQKMFGRISNKKYYIPGVLDNVPFFKIFEGRIFIGTTQDIDFDPVMNYCKKFVTTTTSKDEEEIFLKTGKEWWKFRAKERGYNLRYKNETK